jgi:hypothetical protein
MTPAASPVLVPHSAGCRSCRRPACASSGSTTSRCARATPTPRSWWTWKSVEVICRDRAGSYDEGARSGAPQAQQIADAWHLLRTLAEAVGKTVGAHLRTAFTTAPAVTEPTTMSTGMAKPLAEEMPFAPPDGTRASSGARGGWWPAPPSVHGGTAAAVRGKSLTSISRQLQLDHSTVRRFARAQSFDELLVKATNRTSILDEHKPYLHERWREGCHDIPQLHHELRARGFTGSIQSLRRCFRPFKKSHSPKPENRPAPAPELRPAPKPRRVVRWIMTSPAHLTETDSAELKEIRAACPHLDATARQVRDFADMMRDLRDEELPAWMDRVLAEDLAALHSVVNGMKRDLDAVTAGLSTPWSSGQVEGHVTRAKLLTSWCVIAGEASFLASGVIRLWRSWSIGDADIVRHRGKIEAVIGGCGWCPGSAGGDPSDRGRRGRS